jgi:hypothetical protein
LIEAGFSVLAVDHVMHDPQVPVTLLDLTEASHQKILNLNWSFEKPAPRIHPFGNAVWYSIQSTGKTRRKNKNSPWHWEL